MQRVALIENPVSGQHSARRPEEIREALAVLREAGVAAKVYEAKARGDAGRFAHQAVMDGCDTILACGGDGTVHEILQSMVGSGVALGVIPFGTANALAADLGLIASPADVVRILLGATPTRVPVGRIHYRDIAGQQASRYFVVAAGVGADALLMSRMDARLKRRWGYVLYVAEAFRIWATHSFPLFNAAFHQKDENAAHEIWVSQLLAVRVRSFGGALQELAPGATVRNGTLQVMAFKTQSRFRFLKFFLAVLMRRHSFNGAIELVDAASVHCHTRNAPHEEIFVEADGEVLGELPVRMEVVHDALTLLIPAGARP
jgi:YegS/Rv2252/BmrU family lipid kinase